MTSSPFAQLDALAPPSNWRALFGWRRVRTVAILCALFLLLFSFGWKAPLWQLVARVFGVGLALLLVFGLFGAAGCLAGWLAGEPTFTRLTAALPGRGR